jgi:DNA (cytosine-5)-methyltransferase 1
MLTVGSLFSGCGGFDLGFHRAGFEVRWQVEIDQDCLNVLTHHWPTVRKYRDVNAVVYGRAKNRQTHGLMLERVDCIIGGFPCQDVSVAGQRQGLAGSRSGLFFAFMRALRLYKPQMAVLENVPGLFSSQRGRDFHTVLTTLAGSGMSRIAWRILDSQYFGVPQRRRRVFVVGCARTCHLDPVAVLFESPRRRRHSPTRQQTGTDVAATLRGRARRAGVNELGRGGEDDVNLIAECLTANYGKQVDNSDRNGGPPNLIFGPLGGGNDGIGRRTEDDPNLVYQDSQYGVKGYHEAGSLRAGRIPEHQMVLAQKVDDDTLSAHLEDRQQAAAPNGRRHPPTLEAGERARALVGSMWKRHDEDTDTLIVSPVTASAGHHGHSSPCGDGRDNLIAATLNSGGNNGGFRTEPGEHIVAFDNGQGDPNTSTNGTAFALNCQSHGGIADRVGVRRLTPLECERLQGFPDGWTCLCGKGHQGTALCECADTRRYRQLGNAVTVPVARWIAERIVLAWQSQ